MNEVIAVNAAKPIVPDYAIGQSTPNDVDPLKNVPINTREYLTAEVGQSGTLNYGGFLDNQEWIGELKGLALYLTVDFMRTDSVISSLEKGFFFPIERANISFAYDNPELVKDPKYKTILDFTVKAFEVINWTDTLHNALLYIPYGFSVFEIIWKEDANGYLVIDRLAPRLPKTAWRWITDGHGYLRVFQQLVYTPNEDGSNGSWQYKNIPATKILLITGQKEGGNFVGRSEYRPFYREWKVKDDTLKQIIISIRRVGGGIPFVRINKDAPDTATGTVGGTSFENLSTVKQWEKILQKIAAGESAYMVGKWIEEMGLLSVNPAALDALLHVCKYSDQSIAKAAFQMYMNLGSSGESGNRALGETFEGLYYQGENGKAAKICEAFSEQLIKRMIDYNFGPQDHYPKMNAEIDQDLSEILKALGELKKNGLYNGNADLENFINSKWALPRTNDKNRIVQAAVPGSTPPAVAPEVKSAVPALSDRRGGVRSVDSLELTDVVAGNKLHAKAVGKIDPAATAEKLTRIKKNMSDELRGIIQPEMVGLARQLISGARPYMTGTPTYGNRVADLFRKYYKQLLDAGRNHVKGELIGQNLKLADKLFLADKSKAPSASQGNFEKWFNDEANLDAEVVWNEAQSDVIRYIKAGRAEGLEGNALQEFVTTGILGEVGTMFDRAAAGVLNAYGTVREISSEELAGEIVSKIRSAIFDANTCDVCAEEDGHEYFQQSDGTFTDDDGNEAPDLDAASENMCEGGSRCRCIYIYSTSDDTRAQDLGGDQLAGGPDMDPDGAQVVGAPGGPDVINFSDKSKRHGGRK